MKNTDLYKNPTKSKKFDEPKKKLSEEEKFRSFSPLTREEMNEFETERAFVNFSQ